MTGDRAALDTNRAIALLNGERDFAGWVAALGEVCLPVPVVGELRYGAINSQRADSNIAAVEALVSRCRVLVIDAATARVYSEARVRLRKKGTPIPENDVWIAALCLQHAMPLATDDAHFRRVEGLVLVAQ